jgi:hypothetical protein
MLIPLGILASAGGVPPILSDYELISTTILGSSTPSVTFSSLGDYASTYKHLQLRWTGRTDTGTGIGGLSYRTNGQTTNYSFHVLEGDGSTVVSASGTSQTAGRIANMTRANSSSVIYSAGVADFLDAFSTTKNKTVRSFAGSRIVGTSYVDLGSSLFFGNQDAISSIELFASNSLDLATGSRFSLYGIKG